MNKRQRVLQHRTRIIVAATISYNILEAIIALTAGKLASSSALIGFGLDSTVEVLSALAVAWQFSAKDPEKRERLTMKVIAISFFGLGILIIFDSLKSLLGYSQAEESLVGMVLATLSLIIMPLLSYAERKTGQELGSASAVADSKQTLLCSYLSAVLLLGLAANWLCGWSWADPLAALVIAGIALKEGWETWQGKGCCANLPLDQQATEKAPCCC